VGDSIVGNRTKVKVVKNKVAPPFRVAEFDILYGRGISFEGDLLDLGLEHDVVGQKGTWFSYGDLQLGQGREKARAYLEENAEVRERLERDVRDAAGLPQLSSAEGQPVDGAEADSEPEKVGTGGKKQ
jgi:recombination protein RecA